MVTFDDAYNVTSPQEGGFQRIRSDHGNWTGGKVGEGKLIGTKGGISAAQYPNLDIPNLTEKEIKEIYLRDYWHNNQIDRMHEGYRIIYFDMCVNHGSYYPSKWIQQSINESGGNLKVDGRIGYITRTQLAMFQPPLDSIRAKRARFIEKSKKINKSWKLGLIKRSLNV